MNEFLIKYNLQNPTCLLKWNWSTIRLFEGTSSSCFRVKQSKISPDTYHQFHNTEQSIRDRTSMQNGIWPGNGCEYCKKIEDAGGISDRILANQDAYSNIPEELKIDNTTVILTPKILEVNFSNLCNLSCIYCGPAYSTVWENEQRKYKNTNISSLNFSAEIEYSPQEYNKLLSLHWDWMKINAKGLNEYHILGGEPLIQPEFIMNLDFFENNRCPNTAIRVFTNLMIPEIKLRNILSRVEELIKSGNIKSFTITCSLDCWGPQQEYIRTGLNLIDWENNFNVLVNEYKNIKLHIHSTLICLTMDTLPILISKISSWSRVRRINHSISFANGVDHMHVGIFPKHFFDEKFNICISNSNSQLIRDRLTGFKNMINDQPHDSQKIKILIEELNKFDARRGTDWKPLWNWLDNLNIEHTT